MDIGHLKVCCVARPGAKLMRGVMTEDLSFLKWKLEEISNKNGGLASGGSLFPIVPISQSYRAFTLAKLVFVIIIF